MAFDYASAVKAGYKDQEIADYLKQSGRNFDVVGAKKAGYTDEEIAAHLQSAPSIVKTDQPQGYQPLKYQEGDNKLMFGLAKAQEFLAGEKTGNNVVDIVGKVANLPTAYAGLGKGIARGSSGGTAAGAATGTYLQQLLKPGKTINDEGVKALLPSGQEAIDIGANAALYGALDFLFTGGKAKVTPLKPLEYRDALAEQSRAVLDGNKWVTAVKKYAEKKASPTDKVAVDKYVKIVETMFKDKKIPLPEALGRLAEFNQAYGGSGAVKTSAAAGVDAALSRAVREELKQVAPNVFKAQRWLASNLALKKAVSRVGRAMPYVAATGVAGAATYGVMDALKKIAN